MLEPPISSRRNPLIKRLRALSTRSGRKKARLILLEGTHLVQELLAVGGCPTELIATEAWLDRHEYLIKKFDATVTWRLVTNEVLRTTLTTTNPDGVACSCPLTMLPEPPSTCDFQLVLDRIQDPGNLGTLLRTALAAEIQVVWMGSGVDPLAPKAIRASAGALLRLPHQRFGPDESQAIQQLEQALKEQASQGVQVVATLVPDANSLMKLIPYWELDWTRPTSLVLGTEGAGLHPCLRACCTHAVTLPHSPRVKSLNVAAAAVPLLMERRRATMTAISQRFG
ncbi:RNA methyltransferase [Synechococcus sp. M16CYN]|uniref:TrmH family RNA methyltransferase n=1 Tax=Synechococcus sp. M16CYN TaxID=3103139 RepID=UPI0032478C4A